MYIFLWLILCLVIICNYFTIVSVSNKTTIIFNLLWQFLRILYMQQLTKRKICHTPLLTWQYCKYSSSWWSIHRQVYLDVCLSVFVALYYNNFLSFLLSILPSFPSLFLSFSSFIFFIYFTSSHFHSVYTLVFSFSACLFLLDFTYMIIKQLQCRQTIISCIV